MTQDHSALNETGQLPEDDDPLVEVCLEDAVGPYLGALAPEEVLDYREFLTVFMKTHPAAAPLYQRLRKRSVAVEVSGHVPREGAEEEAGDDGPLQPCRADGTFGGGRS